MERRAFIAAAVAALTARKTFAADAPLKVLSSMAAQGAMAEIAPAMRSAGLAMNIEFSATVPIAERIDKGEAADLVLVGKGSADRFVKEGKALSATDLFVSEEGLAVADGAPTPVMRNVEDFKRVIAATPSIAVTARGVSGLRLQKLMRDLGLGEVLDKRTVLVDEGFTATRLLKGEVAMAVQQLSELKAAGAKNFVRFPDELQVPTTFSVAVMKTTMQRAAAETAVKMMASWSVAPMWERSLVKPLNN
ncbi:MAG: substrate-binding domain-containing protein [Rhodospirillaceae bacterium]